MGEAWAFFVISAPVSRNKLEYSWTMDELPEWCMQLAHRWLVQGHLKVAEVVARCGYASAAAFNKAFKCLPG